MSRASLGCESWPPSKTTLDRELVVPTIAEMLAQAKVFHGAGRVQDAEQLYQRVVQADSANVEAHYLLGAARHGLKRLDDAVASFRHAIRLSPDHADAHHHLGVTLAQQGKLDEAISSLERACGLNPRSAEMSKNLRDLLAAKEKRLAIALTEQGKLDEAAACYRRALELKPDLAEAHNNLGAVLRMQGRLGEAAACYRRALELNPDLAEANFNLGVILADQNQWIQAVAGYRRALEIKPDFAPAHNNLGSVLQEQGRLDEAVACYHRALELKPDYAEAHNNLGVVLTDQGKLVEAAASYRRAIELKPEVAEPHNNLGMVLQKQGRLDEAALCHRRAIELKPDDAEGHNNLGTVLAQQKKLDEAAACWRRAIELKPDHAPAHHNRALALLLLGRFDEGWPEYEWRFKLKDHAQPPLPRPRWTGEALAGRTILLQSEQGMGDTLQFVRYAPLVKQQSARVIVDCQPPLARLVASCAGVDQVIAKGEALPNFDVHVPLLSLPACFGTTLENIPAKVPYLAPDAELVEQWKAELGQPNAFKIGIAWHGNPAHPLNRARSVPLAQFAGIARLSGVRLYSLQMGAGREQLADLAGQMAITDLGDRLGDFHNTAAILRNLELVITCDSAPAHLAGALGVSVWVALAFVPDWRWMLDRSDSPWYPTMRLFRQSEQGDWDGAFRAIEEELSRIV